MDTQKDIDKNNKFPRNKVKPISEQPRTDSSSSGSSSSGPSRPSSFLSENESALVQLPPTSTKTSPSSNTSASTKNISKKHLLEAIIPKSLIFAVSSFIKNTFIFSKWMTNKTWRYLVLHPSHATLSILLFVTLLVVGFLGREIHQEFAQTEISQSTIDTIIDASGFTRDFSSKNADSKGSRELIKSGSPEWIQKEAVKAVLFHARKNGLSLEHQAVLLATVEVESGFNPMARAATTTACGLFQFVKATGLLFGLTQNDCMNPWLNAEAGVAHYLKNYKMKVESKTKNLQGVEKAFKTFELTYYLHHDGTYSSNHSSEVKAVVLKGTQFLLKTYKALTREFEMRKKAPSFSQHIYLKLNKYLR